jgi:hypothetical protein
MLLDEASTILSIQGEIQDPTARARSKYNEFDRVLRAVILYRARKAGKAAPFGTRRVGARYWYPDRIERGKCCDAIEVQIGSDKYPNHLVLTNKPLYYERVQPLWKHCHTLKHICTILYADYKIAKEIVRCNADKL